MTEDLNRAFGPLSPSNDGLIRSFAADRVLAHHALFQHRHAHPSCPAHLEVIRDLHSAIPRLVTMAFRGFAKSTLTEEAAIVSGLMGEVRNVLILGESETRAADRLRAIKHELEYNDAITELFGDQVGPTWGDTRIITSTGVCFQAYGRGQSLRGVKYLQWRPDLAILDDVEDEEAVATPDARMKTLRWLMSTVLPALGDRDRARVRMLATPLRDGKDLEEKSLPLKLEQAPEWTVKRYPVRFRDHDGEWVATWPQKHDLSAIDALEKSYASVGRQIDFAREYMLEATSDEARVFSSKTIPQPTPPRAPGWQARFAAIDPARTSRETSDYTGWAVWSWDGPKLIVWESGARRLMPNEIVKLCFDLDQRFALSALGVEQDGLDDFLMQPLRLAASERGALPLVPLRAPRGKKNFIAGLQPHFAAGEVELVGASHDMLRAQLLNHPTGHDDAPNALAYALTLRGSPRYPEFSARNVVVEALVDRWDHWLVLACKAEWVAGVLVSVKAPRICVVKDWLEEGDARTIVPLMARDAALEVGKDFRVAAGPVYHERHDTTGLRGAVARIPARLSQSGDPLVGRTTLTSLLHQDFRERANLTVCERAHWALRALSGGVGTIQTAFEPLELPLSALESLLANFHIAPGDLDDDADRRYDTSREGRRYLSASAHARS